MLRHLVYLDQAFLEFVQAQMGVGYAGSDAVFAEARRLDAQLPQHGQWGVILNKFSFSF